LESRRTRFHQSLTLNSLKPFEKLARRRSDESRFNLALIIQAKSYRNT
jgi:hypothetical protein